MSRIIFVALFSVLVGANSQLICPDETDGLTFDNGETLYLQKGGSFEFTCTVNKGPTFLMDKQLVILHRSAKTGTETKISEQGTADNLFPDTRFNFDFQPSVHAKLSIDKVSADMDGEFLCAVRKPSRTLCMRSKKLVVVGGIDKLTLTFDAKKIKKNGDDHIERRKGEYDVQCEAQGSNPKPVIHVHIGDAPVECPNVVMQDDNSDKKRISYKVSANCKLTFTPAMFGKKLSCHAETVLPDSVSITLPDKMASVTLDGIVDKPDVTCQNSTAAVNDRKITVTCRVKSTSPLVMAFNVGNRYILYPGNQTDDLIEVMKKTEGDVQLMILKFYKMEHWHFNAHIYLDVKTPNNEAYQYVVTLIKAGTGESHSASPTTRAITLPFLCLLAAILRL